MSTTTGLGQKGPAERAEADVLADVVDVLVAEAAVLQALHGVVDVQAVDAAAGALDVPGVERALQLLGHGAGQQGLARAGLALDEQRAFEREGDVHGLGELLGGDVAFGTGEGLDHGRLAKTLEREHASAPPARVATGPAGE
jgi:hypothetical protein